jgi:uncharacterized pyridoxamine 5'-phosphate oxidase family protein
LSVRLTACQGFFYRLQSLYTIKKLCWAYVFIAQTSIAEMVITIDFEKCVQFANDHPTCSIATVDGDQPRVRTFGLWFADKDGFYFSSGKTKSIYRQCTANPNVELCFYAPPERPPEEGGAVDIGTMMQATGTVKFLDDAAIKQRLFDERPFLRSVAENVVILHVHNGEAWFWTWEDNLREADIKRIPF